MIRKLLLVPLFLPLVGYAQEATIMPADAVAAAIRTLRKNPPTNAQVIGEEHYAVKVADLVDRAGPGEIHPSEDRVFYVLSGSGSICTGGKLTGLRTIDPGESLGKSLAGCKVAPLAQGTVVSIPRGVPYQLRALSTTLTFLVVRIEGK